MIERNVISRVELARKLGIKSATIAKWKSWFPEPIEYVSDRLILYDLAEVEQAIANRAKRKLLRKPPRRR